MLGANICLLDADISAGGDMLSMMKRCTSLLRNLAPTMYALFLVLLLSFVLIYHATIVATTHG